MHIDAAEFRRVLGHWATGVAIVTAKTASGEPVGLTVNALTSLSLDPPLVIICVDLDSDTHDHIRAQRGFAVNVLPAGAERLARRFAESDAARKFEGVAWQAEETGSPVLDVALAWADCRLFAEHPGGDHTIFVGRVVSADARDGAPLLFYRGGYGRIGT